MKIEAANKMMTDATFRKLLAAASDLAFEFSENGRDGYKITREAFVEMLREGLPRKNFVAAPVQGPARTN
jgi:hypothetical protein